MTRRSERPAERLGGSSFESAYTIVFAVGLVVVSLLSLAVNAFGDGPAGGQHRGLGTAVGIAIGSGGALVYLLSSLGPAYATSARARWLLATPLDRVELLRRSLTGTAAAVAGAGALVGTVVSLATPMAVHTLAGTVMATVMAAVVALAIHQVLLAAESTFAHHPGRRRRVTLGGGAAAVAGLLLTAADLRSPLDLSVGDGAGAWLLVLASSVAVVAVAALAWSVRASSSWCRRLTLAVLRPGGSLVETVTTTVSSFDQTALELRSERLRLGHRAVYPSRRVVGPVWADLLLRDALGAARRWRGTAARGTAVVVVWTLGALFGTSVWVAAAATVTYLTTAYVAAGLRTWVSSSGLRRALPQPHSQVTVLLAVVPLLVGCLVAVVALAGGGLPLTWCAVLAAAAIAGVVRRGRRPPLSMGVVVSTPAGALPTGLVRHLTFGPDLVAVCLLVALRFGPVAGLVSAAAILAWEVRAVRRHALGLSERSLVRTTLRNAGWVP